MKTIIKCLLILVLGVILYYTFLFNFYYLLPMETTQKQQDFDVPDIVLIFNDTIYNDEDMNCGDDDSLPNYNSFINVPAGIEDTIIVKGVIYKMNKSKTHWIPIYPDEDVMWITGSGDTIWE